MPTVRTITQPADSMSLAEARFEAQKLVFGPLLFQATRVLRELGILRALRAARGSLSLEEITVKAEVSRYGALVLLEAGLAAGVVRREGERYVLTKVGACILTDEITGVNLDVVQHCCFQASFYLEDSIREAKPVGLHKVFGDWETIYPALTELPPAARDSWFAWDHYFSDAAFPDALPLVFERRVFAGRARYDPRPSRSARGRAAQRRSARLQGAHQRSPARPARSRQALSARLRRDLDEPVPGVLLRGGRGPAPAARRGGDDDGEPPLHPRHVLGPPESGGARLRAAGDLPLLHLPRERRQPHVQGRRHHRHAAGCRPCGRARE